MQKYISTKKKRILLEIFLSLMVLIFAILLIILIILIRCKRPNKYEEYKLTDISIIGLESFDFIENRTITEYPNDNLGITGKLILDCYTGTCIHEIYHEDIRQSCDDKYCYRYDYSWTEYRLVIDHYCSEQCYETGNEKCNCSEPYDKIGTCKYKTNDEYKKGKVCYAHNIIYFWKGKKYIKKANYYSYIYDDIILKNEEWFKGSKYCGIIDDNENKLCIKTHLNCPINYISENKLSVDYSSVLIGNNTFYYGNDNTTKRKIIAGLVVDTDLLLNQDNDKKDIIDNYTISGLLGDNKELYKDVNLSFDPYNEENIDSKGSSYLRIFYNDQNVNLSSLREAKNNLFFNINMNIRFLNSIHYKTKVITYLGIIALGYLIIAFTNFLIFQTKFYKRNGYNSDCHKGIYGLVIIIFLILFISPLIFGCINVKKAKDAEILDPNQDYSKFKIFNIVFIIIGFTLFLYLIAYIVLVPIECCFNEPFNRKPSNDISSATINNTK